VSTVAIGYVYGTIEPAFHHSLNALLAFDATGPRQIVDVLPYASGPNLSHARNELVRRFLEHPTKPSWFLSVDSDMSFARDLVVALTDVGDATERPVVGALCFGVRPMPGTEDDKFGWFPETLPTIYTVLEDGRFQHWIDYPPNALVQCHATGAAALLVHRSVFEAIPEPEDGSPLRWFAEASVSGGLVSEDCTFCLRAGAAGFPIYVHTGIEVGHVKPIVLDARFHEVSRQLKAAIGETT
jgi:hypothetical protein